MSNIIEIKEWDEYDKNVKAELLHHWWYYYGKMIITLDEQEQFNKLVEEKNNELFLLAILCYIKGISSQPLICAMRKNKVDELLSSLPKIEEIDDKNFKTAYTYEKNNFISMLVDSYNNPKPNVPMNHENVVTQVLNIVKNKK